MPAEIADWLDADCVVMETDLSPVCDLMKATNKSWVTERGSGESRRDHVHVWFWSDRKHGLTDTVPQPSSVCLLQFESTVPQQITRGQRT